MPDLDTEELALVPLPLDSVLFVQLSAPAMRYFPSLSLKYSKLPFANVCVSVRVSVVVESSSSFVLSEQAVRKKDPAATVITAESISVAILSFLDCLFFAIEHLFTDRSDIKIVLHYFNIKGSEKQAIMLKKT